MTKRSSTLHGLLRAIILHLSTKQYIFYFKVEKELIGVSIEVVDDCLLVVAPQILKASRTLLPSFICLQQVRQSFFISGFFKALNFSKKDEL